MAKSNPQIKVTFYDQFKKKFKLFLTSQYQIICHNNLIKSAGKWKVI